MSPARDDTLEGSGVRPVGDLDYLSYVEFAISRTAELADAADHKAMEIAISLHRLSHALARATETTAHRPEGWSLAGFRAMFMLWVVGPTRPARMAAMLDMTRPATSNVLSTLERDGLVERTPDAGDGRSVILALTDRGDAAVRAVFAIQNRIESRWLDVLDSDERDELARVLRKVIAASLHGREARYWVSHDPNTITPPWYPNVRCPTPIRYGCVGLVGPDPGERSA
jgi:DNA-binding MarR family transcriptional regulator